jgi:hypothetical protein
MRGKAFSRFAVAIGLVLIAIGRMPNATAEPGIAVATNQIMAGLYAPQQWFSRDHIVAVNQATGKNVSIGGMWVDVDEWPNNVTHMLEEIWSAGATPFVNIHVPGTAAQVAAGEFDASITNLGAGVNLWLAKGGERSVLLAPMPEMNGDWIPYGMDPTNFKTAYRRFVNVASRSGATGWNVRWVFAPNGWSAPPHRMASYYPGPDVVDLVGMSAYNWGSNQPGLVWTTVEQTMGGALDEARGFAPEKPFLIAQTASSPFGGDKDAWIREMFRFLAEDRNAVGFIYFNIEKEHDWAIYKGSTLNQGWKDGMALETTVYQWPLSDWFDSGALTVDTYLLPFEGTFSDDDASLFVNEIEWLAQTGITTGCGPERFCPTSPVSRGEMASFLYRALALPLGAADFFDDDAGSPHEEAINAVRAASITNGCSATNFCPHGSTTRAQMASFLVRAIGYPPALSDFFTDDNASIHQANINSLRQSGVTSGCTATTYCPEATVSREQMAAFLYRALGP